MNANTETTKARPSFPAHDPLGIPVRAEYKREDHSPMAKFYLGHWKSDHVLKVAGKRHGLGGWTRLGTGRIEFGGPLVPGPVAYSFGLCVVIDNHGGTGAESERMQAEGRERVAARLNGTTGFTFCTIGDGLDGSAGWLVVAATVAP